MHEWRLRSSATYLREKIFERDRGVCALCRLDTERERRRILRLSFGERMKELSRLQQLGSIPRKRKSWWDADHILPVVEGGDSTLQNVRTLCYSCHRQMTAELRERRRKR